MVKELDQGKRKTFCFSFYNFSSNNVDIKTIEGYTKLKRNEKQETYDLEK